MGFSKNVNTIMAYRTMRAIEQQHEEACPPCELHHAPRKRTWRERLLRLADKAAGVPRG